jgi:hypothetical protein
MLMLKEQVACPKREGAAYAAKRTASTGTLCESFIPTSIRELDLVGEAMASRGGRSYYLCAAAFAEGTLGGGLGSFPVMKEKSRAVREVAKRLG